jgi:D-alanyl-D-alanine dipeptidase
MKKIAFILLSILSSTLFAATPPQQIITKSEQLLLVTTPSWDAINGQLQRYERKSTKAAWKPVGTPIPVVIGKHGTAWDVHFITNQQDANAKHEGDGKTPVGIYEVGPMFGFDATTKNKTDYFPLDDNSVCVDDVKSAYYNQLIDSAKVPQKDWNSGEQMHTVPQYKIGGMVQYNTGSTMIRGAGSCIFLHIWKGPTAGTAGCVAMDEANLTNTLKWLNSRKNPVIAVLPQPVVKEMSSKWKLPNQV